ITELFRAVHNMKGMSAAMGYQSIRDLSHGLETLLEKLRRDQSTPSPAVIDVLFEAVDLLESGVVLVSANPDAVQDVSEMVSALEALAAAASLDDIPTLTGTMEWPIPSAVEPTPQQTRRFTPARSARLTPTRQPRFTPPLGTRTASFPIVEGKRSVRVDAERLDTLMTLVGELVIARGRLTDLSRKANNVELTEVVAHASRLVGTLQDEITKSRMVPVGQAFERFDRLVRDASHELGKQVNFELRGTDIEVDKSVLDEIGDPVMHLLRNAIDHGVGTPAERKAAGKSPIAKLVLSAERERSAVVITVRDDGRGVDSAKVIAAARQRGLIDNDRDNLSESELLDLIARPGFSTASGVTRISGRGVGLDVVATKVRSLGGSLEMVTAYGKGTKMIVRLPMTLAIVQALLTRTGGEVYALPISHVVETLVLSESAVSFEDGREMIEVRGERLPAVRLRAKLGYEPRERGHVAVLDLSDRRFTLVVDEFIGQHEVVVKPFDPARGMPQIFSGATILPSGAPALILDARGVA
ncbi:MAG TPA: chemotaxis protein CheA, partial [Gemmatimonadaceae bacterium]|nr:chemotaxis protein CheA [Gemmatimonadaceae bacterium]